MVAMIIVMMVTMMVAIKMMTYFHLVRNKTFSMKLFWLLQHIHFSSIKYINTKKIGGGISFQAVFLLKTNVKNTFPNAMMPSKIIN